MENYDLKLITNLVDKQTGTILKFYSFFWTNLVDDIHFLTQEDLFRIINHLQNKNIVASKNISNIILDFSKYLYELFSTLNEELIISELNQNLQENIYTKELNLSAINYFSTLQTIYSYLSFGGLKSISNKNFEDKYFEFYFLKYEHLLMNKFNFLSDEGIVFCLNISGNTIINNTFCLTENDILICNKDQVINSIQFCDKNCALTIFIVKFSFLNSINFVPIDFKYIIAANSFDKKIITFIEKTNFSIIDDYYNLMYLGIYLLYLTLDSPLKMETFIIDQNRKTILNIINNNIYLSDNEIINIILNELDVSISNLYKIFNFSFENKPSKIIGDLKVKKAFSILIESNNYPLEFLASQFSYSEIEFKNKFVAVFGMTPTKLLKNIKENVNV
ncbi:MAG: hypothetical protein ACRDDH_16935 [Cetobacterium sp.]|uniref:hypothetical protein n=1 Tax=Cetobacterium sp. TaxID=2071632 RepID=UPI003EE818B2